MCVFLSPGWSPSSFVRGERMGVGGEHRGLVSEGQSPGLQTQLYHLKAIYKRTPGKLIGIVSPSETQLSAYKQPSCGNEMVSLLFPKVPCRAVGSPAAQVCWKACLHPQNTMQSWSQVVCSPHSPKTSLCFKKGDRPLVKPTE